jgi:hypothetical protein
MSKKKKQISDNWIANFGKTLKEDGDRRKKENDLFWLNVMDGKVELACKFGTYIHVDKPTTERHVVCKITSKTCVCTSHSYNSDGPVFNSNYEDCPGMAITYGMVNAHI